ncbi:MAG TPA: S9 family peptidase [Streptosporangiaceae bacterium]|nr:S9 family peptidase [Streptosporangiaceae bacterium]
MSDQSMQSQPPQLPVVKRLPSERTYHGDTFIDDYAWLADKDNPETIAFLESENAYTDALTAGHQELRETIFGEIKSRTKESDLSVPSRKGGWWYYSRTIEGKQYPVNCRRAVRPEDAGPPMSADGSPLDGEEILLDQNDLAGDNPFFAVGAFDVSPDGNLLAYSTDLDGDERYTMRFKNLVTGEVAPDEIPDTYYGTAWSADATALFYITVNDAWRPYRVWRHVIGSPASEDALVFQEDDEKFNVGVGLSRSERYLMIGTSSSLTSEIRLLDAANPVGEFRVVAPRRPGVEYDVEHQVLPDGTDRLLILHNDGALNFELAQAPLTEPTQWTPLIPHRDDTRLLGVDAFAAQVVVYLRRDGLTGLRVMPAGAAEYEIDFPEPIYQVHPGANPEYETDKFRLAYVSMVTPNSVYDCDVPTGQLTLLKRAEVLPGPDGRAYDPADYEQQRVWAEASDGTRIPISLVSRKDILRDGTAPFLLYGYGSYEISIDPGFSIPRISLLDRGFVYAIAHIRGGGEMGRHWYDDGKMLRKVNTFSDFVACARHVVKDGWTTADRLIARGGSAGGLLMGAVANMAPDAFGGIVAQVPFVDAVTTMLDPTLPLTVPEWEEWGNPLDDPEVYRYMKSYSPYENVVSDRVYPPILAVTSLNDTRVLYREPAKWIAKLQAEAKGGPFLLKTEMAAGHGGRSGRYDAWREEALVLAWIVATATG